MKKLILTVGLPKSGKTTWAKKQGHPIVNPDSIRLALHGERYIALAEPMVWVIAKIMVVALFLSGHDTVIVDATNNTVKRRGFWQDDKWDVHCQPIDTSAGECIRRAKAEGDTLIIPVIERMNEEKEPIMEEVE